MATMQERVENLIVKAAQAEDSNDALKFSQAASNAASALCALAVVRQKTSEVNQDGTGES